jgi:hypothetical protein
VVVVDPVLNVRAPVGNVEHPLGVGLVFGEEHGPLPLAVAVLLPQFPVDCLHDAPGRGAGELPERRPLEFAAPGPLVAEPDSRQEVQVRRLRAAVGGTDADRNVLRSCLGVLHEDVEVAVLVEHAGVEQLVLGHKSAKDGRSQKPVSALHGILPVESR